MHLLVLQEVPLNVEVLATDRTVIRSRAAILLMGLLVLLEVVLPREVLPTDWAREQLLPGVGHDVPHEVLLAAERFAATRLVALERPQTDVRLEVLHQVFLPLERLGANITGSEAHGGGDVGIGSLGAGT